MKRLQRTMLGLEWNEDITTGFAIRWVHLDASKECSSWFGDADEEQEDGGQDRGVDTVLDGRENGHEDACSPDDEFKRRDEPERIDLAWRGDEIGDGVDNDGGKTGEGDEEESVGETIEGDDDDDSSDPTSGWGPDTALGLESGAREGSGSGQCGEDRSDGVCHSDGDKLLVGVDLVTVDTTKGLGDGDVFQKQDEGCNEQL